MKTYMTKGDQDGHTTDSASSGLSEDDYTLVGQGYFWTLKFGCLCPQGSTFGSTPHELCTDEKKDSTNNCIDVPQASKTFKDLPVVNKKKYCAFRDSSYQIMELERPDIRNKCNQTTPMKKLCGPPTGDYKKNFCIPEKSKCPITGLTYDATSGDFKGSTDPANGLPIFDVQLSQNGPPCVDGNHNSLTQKSTYKFMNDKYNKGCTEVEIGKTTFKTQDKAFVKIPGFQIDEYTLLSDNDDSGSFLSSRKSILYFIKMFESFDESKLKNYEYEMYQRHFHSLLPTCVYEPTKPEIVKPVKAAGDSADADAATSTANSADATFLGETTQSADTVTSIQLKTKDLPVIMDQANSMIKWV